MAEVTKYQLITNTNNNNNSNNNNSIISELKTQFSIFKTRKNKSFIYGVVLLFVLFTVFLAFSPSSSSTSPWFVNIFTVNSTSPNDDNNNNSNNSSHLPSVYSYFFPNSTPSNPQISPFRSHDNATFQKPISENLNFTNQSSELSANQTVFHQNISNSDVSDDKGANFEHNITQSSQISANQTIFPQNISNTEVSGDKGANFEQNITQSSVISANLNGTGVHDDKVEKNITQSAELSANQTVFDQKKLENLTDSQVSANQTSIEHENPSNVTKKGSGMEVNSSDLAASLSKNQGKAHENDTVSPPKKKGGNEVEGLLGCDLYDGGWIRDESYPLYKPGSCKFVDEQFNCVLNGRPDFDYQKLKWKPNACSIPRLNGGHMLELLRGKRLVFVGDSLNRNMWESLVCILKNSVKDKKKVYEAFGRHHFRTEASYSFVFKDYNCTVEFYVAPFLVQQWELKEKDGTTKETLRLDLMVSDADQYKTADYIVFNTGHWWTHDKTSKGEDYYQEGSHVYKQLDVTEAFRRAITTWSRWVDANIDPQRTHVLFRGYSASHFSGGQWNSGGKCDGETEPIKNDTYLTPYPLKMKVFETVVKGMKIPVSYLNVTRLTDYRKDGHPSVYRKQNVHLSMDEKKSPLRYQDCSHWCLPGVPDSWNELLYAELLRKQYSDSQQKNKT